MPLLRKNSSRGRGKSPPPLPLLAEMEGETDHEEETTADDFSSKNGSANIRSRKGKRSTEAGSSKFGYSNPETLNARSTVVL
ncbi:unnamed protein product [Arabis nemorensis]|uniref:Uncharacterized protein n=1 Tax=Arabis nemorensis TaxID=586526 RepID=A0A565ATE1_9BRAS|nr:unnamed protein product [Arabis nemorensis]